MNVLGLSLRRGDRTLQCWRNGGRWGNGGWSADGLRLLGVLGGRLLRGRSLRVLIDRHRSILLDRLR